MKNILLEEQFRESLVLHPAFETTANKVIEAIYSNNEHPIIAVYGPPGVGKTALIRYVLSKVIKQESERMEQDREYIPIVGVRVPSPETRQFPWRDTYHTMIEGLFDPASRSAVNFRDYKTKPLQRGLGFEFPTEKYLGRGTKQTLYRHFLRVLEHRKSLAIAMDEAHHFVSGQRNMDQRMQLLSNRLKSMADEMGGTKLLLVGTHKMNECLEATYQSTRRLKMFHFDRYQYPDFHDASDPFLVAVCSLEDILDGQLTFSLFDHAEELYKGCLGCIGLLKSWLGEALEKAQGKKITLQILEEAKMCEAHLNQAMEEILAGELYTASLNERNESLWEKFAPKAVKKKQKRTASNKHPFLAKPRVFKKGFSHAK